MNKLIFVKIGTNSIVTPNGQIRKKLLDNIALSVSIIKNHGYRVAIVSSGAIACGKIITKQALSNQAYASIGQPDLMTHWQRAFAKVGLITAQGLYVNNNLRNKKNQLSITKTLGELLIAGVVPIINENDTVTDAEIKALHGFGDNDQLASILARAKKAEFLFLLTTVDGIICPKTDKIIPHLFAYEYTVEKNLRMWKGDSNGGMPSKVKSAKDFVKEVKGARAIIASYQEPNILFRSIIAKEQIGTVIT